MGVAAWAGTGIVYTCDPSVTNLAPQACNVLNTTIAGLYAAAFTSANAPIYVTIDNSQIGGFSQSFNFSPTLSCELN